MYLKQICSVFGTAEDFGQWPRGKFGLCGFLWVLKWRLRGWEEESRSRGGSLLCQCMKIEKRSNLDELKVRSVV